MYGAMFIGWYDFSNVIWIDENKNLYFYIALSSDHSTYM